MKEKNTTKNLLIKIIFILKLRHMEQRTTAAQITESIPRKL